MAGTSAVLRHGGADDAADPGKRGSRPGRAKARRQDAQSEHRRDSRLVPIARPLDPGARRGPHGVLAAGATPGQGCRIALLRRSDRGGDRGCSKRFSAHGQARLGFCQGLVIASIKIGKIGLIGDGAVPTMSPERLRRIEELYHAAREGTAEERAALLAQTDPELRREVELLLSDPSGSEFLDRPAIQNAPELLADSTVTVLAAGVSLGPYRIEGKIGEGGMGAVYRATDTRLGREVALKFLSPWLARDAEYMARFEREAKVLASLNHPNIAIVHGLEESNGTRALVMELVEGPTLAARIAEGPIPLKEALRVAEAIAEGLEAAHEKGIVHRDLKPGNVKISPEGGVKVLDFGLAKMSGTPSGPAQDPSALTGETEPGTILGTVGYMSPEQASGKPADKRADIWAFGVVLWEMLTGKRLFAGETVSHTLAEVLAAPIDFDKLPKETPPAIRNLVRRCLERDAKNRLRDIGEARIALQACLSGSAVTVAAEKELALPKRTGLIWILGAAVVLLAGIASWALWPKAPTRATRFQVTLPDNVQFNEYVSISPDGHKLVFNATGEQSGLWVHDLDTLEWRRLAGTEGGRSPFWSPDSNHLGFAV